MPSVHRFSFCSAALLALLTISVPVLAQTPPPLPNYTLHQNVREVLTDITVTDANGNPVTGLPASAFHIYDNGNPQTINSFVEHSSNDLAVLPSSTASGVYSNSYLSHPPAAFNIAVIDITTMTLIEQMVLRQQLVHFLQQLPPGEPLAVYMRNGPHIVLVHNFTTSRAALLAAIRYAIPRFQPGGAEHYTDEDALSQMAAYLSQYPGRKNLLWFSGGSNSFLLSDAQLAGYSDDTQNTDMRSLYDELETERIAVYPIDVRGLVLSADLSLVQQQLLMSEEAATTGGQAFYNTNAIARSARQILDHSADFYTLTYSPNNLHQRGHWHKLRIRINGPYHLSYRQGYFDDNSQAAQPLKPFVTSNGEQIQLPDLRSSPIIFKAEILPAATASVPSARNTKPPRGTVPYVLYCALPVSAFPIAPLDAQHSVVTIGLGIVVLDSHGEVVSHKMHLLQFRVKTADLHAHADPRTLWQHPISLPKGQNNVFLAIWNTKSGRLGTLQIPLDVTRHHASRH